MNSSTTILIARALADAGIGLDSFAPNAAARRVAMVMSVLKL